MHRFGIHFALNCRLWARGHWLRGACRNDLERPRLLEPVGQPQHQAGVWRIVGRADLKGRAGR